MKYFLPILALLFATSAWSQTIVIDIQDVEIRFPTATENTWKPADVVSIAYSSEPVLPENPFARLGQQQWEGLMCNTTESNPRKYVIVIQVLAIPSPKDRTMELRVRCRYGDDSAIGPWSDPGSVKIQGDPKNVNPQE